MLTFATYFLLKNPDKLRKLTAASMILLATWEARTHLRRIYGLNSKRNESKAKAATKDLAKAPTKVQGVTGEKFWDDVTQIMTGLQSPERMMETCKNFVELLNVDKEVTIGGEDEDLDADGEPHTPEAEGDDGDAPPTSTRGRKRKADSTPGSRKKRARSGSRGPRGRGRPSDFSDEEDYMEFA